MSKSNGNLPRDVPLPATVGHAACRAEGLRAGLEFYRRAYPTGETFNATTTSPLPVPIVPAGGDRSIGPAKTTIAKALRDHGCEDVIVEPVRESGHWVVDEQRALVAALIERYAAFSMRTESLNAW